jgi:hypothetical protein
VPDVLALASSGLLVAVSWAGLRRLRARRFRAAVPGGRPPARAIEAAAFAALGAAGLGSLVHHAAPAAFGSAAEWTPRLALAAALPAWHLAGRAAPRGFGPGGTPELAGAAVLLAAALALLLAGPAASAAHALEHALVALAGIELLRFAGEREHARRVPRAPGGTDAFAAERVLKTDLFGRIERGRVETAEGTLAGVRRDFRAGALWLRPVAAVLARREARALVWLEGVERVPRLLDRGRGRFLRSYVDGRPLAEAAARDPAYFAAARRLLRRIHAVGVTHNDTHKVHNWLVTPDGGPALVDFQIAGRHVARTRWFRLCALEDVRHLLKHKRRFCPAALTARERRLLERRSWIARGWLATVKPVYVVVTRRVLGWRDGEGRGRAPR